MRGTERVHVDYTLENMEQRNADLLSRADVTDGPCFEFPAGSSVASVLLDYYWARFAAIKELLVASSRENSTIVLEEVAWLFLERKPI